jgi:NAD-dependent deacetylase
MHDADALTRLHAGEADPPRLECGGVLKTATVMFGQSLDPVVLDRAFGRTRPDPSASPNTG